LGLILIVTQFFFSLCFFLFKFFDSSSIQVVFIQGGNFWYATIRPLREGAMDMRGLRLSKNMMGLSQVLAGLFHCLS